MIKIFLLLFLIASISTGCGQQSKEEIRVSQSMEPPSKENLLIIADFDSGEKPNNIGGDFGAWDKDPQDYTQTAVESFMPTIKHREKGFSLQIYYDVDSPNPAYNGFWMKLNHLDASKYNLLGFWIKGDELRGFTKVFKVELKNAR